jgi:hypothetical protein
LKLYYSGAIELWGITIPQFSRGRYISSRQVEVYNVGLLFPPPVLTPQPYHRCLYLYNPSDAAVDNATLEVVGPFPPTRPEEVHIALGAQSPTFYVDFLEDENASPSIFGVWSASLTLSIPSRSAFPVWLRLEYRDVSTPTSDSYFILRVNGEPVTYVVYSYRSQQVQLPRDLWGVLRSGLRQSAPLVAVQTTPPPIYQPAGFLRSLPDSITSLYPLVDGFAESDYIQKVIRVLAIAIAEFWLSADAAARFSASATSVDGDAFTILGIPTDLRADALLHLSSLLRERQADALAIFANALTERLGDAVAHLSSNALTFRADALAHIGTEWIKRGDSLTFVATGVGERAGDAFVRCLTIDDILDISPLPATSVWGVSIIPPLSLTTLRVPFVSATLHATSLVEESRVRVLLSSDGNFWMLAGTVPVYPDKLVRPVGRGYLRFRNERDDWVTVVWALIP